RGFRVVAIEANPMLARALECRFAGKPVCGEDVCIGPSEAQRVPFWVNQDNYSSSAFDHELATRDGTSAEMIELPSVTMRNLLDRWGVPHYLKIDIEGM